MAVLITGTIAWLDPASRDNQLRMREIVGLFEGFSQVGVEAVQIINVGRCAAACARFVRMVGGRRIHQAWYIWRCVTDLS